ncbi:2-C-methyl-D-erythritol 4-phosphate cytidylyltransferase [Cellvibrio zantedeschiae]|uniref:2-C-methyl-D-erythritol 4-phosphate cytidylyltransferase n=1 Tax=Cellvibrio zantedeschiae TaxID=1237077 RepID=A0ABQ3AW97_9GAMM|nr:2-C-methyl-D-erythritol 4-phosphate cytidylyltransferase [Cellvibrio zantedeschiae]GGY69304.1 2-C-methyl-D-erythritol 4-phosphate cytidylyltransferase [Cellvibrio zantedeschiae]
MPLLTPPRYWFVIPAAGIGARMGAGKPKQYLMLGDKTILEHTLLRILALPGLAGIVVPLSSEDSYWTSLTILQHPLVHTIHGGTTRADSVLSGLDYLADKSHALDWVLVHDAARPCVTVENIQTLCNELSDSDIGGILAVPVSDTLKQVVNKKEIQTTVDRSALWQAQTPQMFRYKLLRDCLTQTIANNETITDESSAIELCGYKPLVVEGRADNIKITRPDDLLLAEFILQQQQKSHV